MVGSSQGVKTPYSALHNNQENKYKTAPVISEKKVLCIMVYLPAKSSIFGTVFDKNRLDIPWNHPEKEIIKQNN